MIQTEQYFLKKSLLIIQMDLIFKKSVILLNLCFILKIMKYTQESIPTPKLTYGKYNRDQLSPQSPQVVNCPESVVNISLAKSDSKNITKFFPGGCVGCKLDISFLFQEEMLPDPTPTPFPNDPFHLCLQSQSRSRDYIAPWMGGIYNFTFSFLKASICICNSNILFHHMCLRQLSLHNQNVLF